MKGYILRYERAGDSDNEHEAHFNARDDHQARVMRDRFVEDGIVTWYELTDDNGNVIGD